MIFLLDSTAFGDLVQDRGGIRARLKQVHSPDQVVTVVIARGEVLHGLLRMPRGKRQRQVEEKVAELFSVIAAHPVPLNAAEEYARIKLARQRVGRPLDENDLWIAATAVALGATLVTRDSDLNDVPGLAVVDWTA